MPKSIDYITSIKLDDEEFPIRNLQIGLEPDDMPCRKCNQRASLKVWTDVCQLGFLADCNIVLFHCAKCGTAQAIRFWIAFDPRDELEVTRYARMNVPTVPTVPTVSETEEQ